MPKCARCKNKTYDGTRWKSSTKGKMYNGKFLCSECQKKLSSLNDESIPDTQTKSGPENKIGVLQVYCPKCNVLFDSEKEMLDHYWGVHVKGLVPIKQRPYVQIQKIEKPTEPPEQKIIAKNKNTFLTSTVSNYLSVSIIFMTLGVFLRSPPIIYTGLVPLFFITIGLMIKQPKTITISQKELKSSCYVGEVVEVASEIEINNGCGFMVIREQIPEHFELAEGTNLKVIWKGPSHKKETMTFKVRCTKRGIYSFGKIDWEFRHVLGLRQTLFGRSIEEKPLNVHLGTIPIRKIRNRKTLSKLPLPLGALNKSGISTTDFKEIREYSFGDSFKNINWKITSRMSNKDFLKPFINVFEKEGKKFVWVFIDGSYSMGSQGTVISNAFENAVTAANDLSQYYLERDCFVGIYMYNKKHQLIYPDIGRKQHFKISRGLLSMEMDEDEPLKESIQRCRSYLIGNAPLSIIITSLSEGKVENLIEGIKELRKYNKSHIKSVLIINVKSYSFVANDEKKQLSAKILQCKDYPIVSRLRETGTTVIDWNPVEQPLTHILLSEVKRR
jgi:uncharacterized protein (DUF58 family)